VCQGARLKPPALAVRVAGLTIAEFVTLTIDRAAALVADLKLTAWEAAVAREILRQLQAKLTFLLRVGLGYLTLARQTRSLSGGEAQRINLANQLGSQLVGTLYVLDEPSIGLHQRDNERLLGTKRCVRIGCKHQHSGLSLAGLEMHLDRCERQSCV
jgi:excinuclease ABC subunit A